MLPVSAQFTDLRPIGSLASELNYLVNSLIEILARRASQDLGRAALYNCLLFLAHSYGHRRVIPGSVCESVINLKSRLQQLGGALHELVPKVENASGQQRSVEYEKYERHLVNSLILISCLARNLFHRFPRLAEQFYIQMYDYEGKLSEESTRPVCSQQIHQPSGRIHHGPSFRTTA